MPNNRIKGCGFHHLSMRVRDIEASLKFYRDTLGFVEKTAWGEGEKRTVLLDTGDGNYFEISQGEAGEGGSVYHHIALRADDCGAALEAARAAGVEVTMETRDISLDSTMGALNLRIAFFKGPDGELVELFQNEQT